MEKDYISWEKFQLGISRIAQWARDKEFDNILGIPRGGLVVAVCMSHQLDIPLVNKIEGNTLVLDDICDSGHTLAPYHGLPTATIYYKPNELHTPDYHAFRKHSRWIVFPFERDETSKLDYVTKLSQFTEKQVK